MGSIYFNGSELTSHTVSFNGTEMANVWFNGTKIWTAYTPSAQTYTSTSTYTIDDSETSIQWKISGGGGGGGGNQCKNGTAPGGAGGTTTITVKDAGGSVRATLGTAAGGVGGATGGNTCVGTQQFSIPGGWANPPWSSTISDGGRGGGGEENCVGGCPGACGASSSGTYTINADGNDATLAITIGGGGAGNRLGEGHNSDPGEGGAAWILGVQG